MDQFNLAATFSSEEDAQEAERRLKDLPVQVTRTAEDHVAAIKGEMHEEVESTVVGAGNVGPFTKGQSRGIAKWTPLAAGAGALIMLPLAFVVWPSMLGFILLPVIGAAAGATIGFVAGGSFNPKYHDEPRLVAEKGPTVGVHASDEEPLQSAREILHEVGAVAVWDVGPDGLAAGSSSESARRPVRE